jgi:polysaccharide export outer membrane protein
VRASTRGEYRIGPLDKLNITVFQVKDLTLDRVQVDASGRILLPLIGQLNAAGRTTTELSDEIAARLAASYLQNPQVSVVVSEAASQKVTVDGAVTEAGVFELRGRTTLLQAVAMAKGPARNANLRRVAVFREIDGQRQAAVFDLKAIRKGKAEDPEIYGDDVIVVDSSGLKGAWREVLGALPAFSIFRPY